MPIITIEWVELSLVQKRETEMVAMKSEKVNVNRVCQWCSESVPVAVHLEDVQAWQGGELIQTAMPYLTAGEREMFISQTCDDCWNKMFGDEE